MNKESHDYMKDKSDTYRRLAEAKKLLEVGKKDALQNTVLVGGVYVTKYLDDAQRDHFKAKVCELLAMEIQEIERKMEEL